MSTSRLNENLEKVLQRFCNSELQQMYQQMNDQQKNLLLAVIKSVFLYMPKYNTQVPLQTSSTSQSIHIKDPLLRSVSKALLHNEFVNEKELKEILFRFGSKVPKVLAIAEHIDVAQGMKINIGKYQETSLTNSSTIFCYNVCELSPIAIRELKLFETATGKYLEGTIITPPIVFTGITTFLEDDNGDYVQLGLYNLLPGAEESTKQQYAERKISVGTSIRIIEPLYKIFVTGQRGIRVYTAQRIYFKNRDFEDIRKEGKQLVQSKDFTGALEVYMAGLKIFEKSFVLLNNRAQSYLNTGKHEEALMDAAAVLLSNHKNTKARHRYTKALECLGYNKQNIDKKLWMTLLRTDCHRSEHNMEKCNKESGNKLFKEKRFSEAIIHYSSALEDQKEVCILLNNISIVCIKLQMYQTAIAAANACLRITTDEEYQKKARFSITKSLSMLGENGLARLSARDDVKLKMLYDQSFNIQEKVKKVLYDTIPFQNFQNHLESINLEGEYINTHISKHCYIEGKGRGLIAKKNFSRGELLIVDLPFLSQNSDHCETSNESISMEITAKLGDMLLQKVKHDGLLAKKLMLLEFRGGVLKPDSQPLPLVDDLHWMGCLSFSFEVPPFLPQTPQEMGLDRNVVTPSFVVSVISTNSFAWSHYGRKKLKAIALALRTSFLNHSYRPNCEYVFTKDALVVISNRFIKRGEELTIKYNEKEFLDQFDQFRHFIDHQTTKTK